MKGGPARPPFTLSLLVAASVLVPVLCGGGFSAGSRLAFALLAALALLEAMRRDFAGCVAAARRAPAVILVALAVLGSVSAAWSLAGPADALRWSLVVAGYAALLVAAAVLAGEPRGAMTLAGIVCASAAVAAAAGMWGIVIREEPLAYRVGGSWLAAGTLEYPAGLALLQVSALPALLCAMHRGNAFTARLAAFCAGMAACALALSGSRVAVALAALVALAPIALPRLAGSKGRPEAAAAAATLGLAAAATGLILGGYVSPGAQGGEAGRLVAVLAIPALVAAAWPRLRGLAVLRSRRGFAPIPKLRASWVLAAAVALVLASLFLVAAERPSGAAVEPSGGFDAGRHVQWSAAVEAFGDRPLLGAGADSFLEASARYQGVAPIRYAHDLVLETAAELGIAGAALAVALYVSTAAGVWRARRSRVGWLLGPAALAFLVANLVDWPWHLAALGAVWAISMGGVLRVD